MREDKRITDHATYNGYNGVLGYYWSDFDF